MTSRPSARLATGALFLLACSKDPAPGGGTGGAGGGAGRGGSGGSGQGGTGGSGGGGTGGTAGTGGQGGAGGSGGAAGTGGRGGAGLDAGRRDGPRVDARRADGASGADASTAALDRMCTPRFTLLLRDTGPKGQLFLSAMGGSTQAVEATVHQIGRDICRTLYRAPSEVRAANEIELTIEDYDGVAGKSGDIGKISVSISSRYLQQYKDSGGDVAREIKGILYHEMTHMYQHDDKPEGNWPGLANYYEATADAVRIRFGHAPDGCRPGKTRSWENHNYCSGGYWWLWVDTKHPDFLYKLNLQLRGRDGRAWKPADATAIAGVSLDALWTEYQAAACCSGASTTCCK